METVKRFAWILLGALAFGRPLWADAQDAFKQGNAAYAAAKFDDAVADYQSAESQGLHHWMLDYNLGNALFKTGKLGSAILHYERAFRRHSSDRDLVYNLSLASAKAGDPRLPTGALPALFWRLFYQFSINAMAVVMSVLWIALCIGLGALLRGRWQAHGDKVGVLAVITVAWAVWFGTRVYVAEEPSAIVVAPTADVRSGPNLSYPANFSVPEGHRVLLLDEQEAVSGWLEIGVPDQGLKGWAPENAVEKI